jgi:folate-dependent phosphoribosylglycinamide formyltransferase PurN
MSGSGTVVLLTSDHPRTRALANSARALAHAIMKSGIALTGIIVETTPEPRTWKNRVRGLLGEDLCMRLPSWRWSKEERQLARVERQLRRKAEEPLAEFLGDESRAFPGVKTLMTENVNSEESQEFLKNEAPDLLVAFGTGILRKSIFQAGRLGAINAHTSVLPEYRGSWPEFWQVYDRAYTKTGISIHFIDEGVDTGDIVHTRHVVVGDDIDPFFLRTLNIIEIVRDYPAVIRNILRGTFARRPQNKPSTPVTRFTDVTSDVKRELFRRLRVL